MNGATYSRGIVVTTSGQALDRPTLMSGITITAVTADTFVKLRDGGAAGPVVYIAEGDNATSSFSKSFNPAIKFFHKLYVEIVNSGANSSVSLEVLEP
jgi:hypothetical protein